MKYLNFSMNHLKTSWNKNINNVGDDKEDKTTEWRIIHLNNWLKTLSAIPINAFLRIIRNSDWNFFMRFKSMEKEMLMTHGDKKEKNYHLQVIQSLRVITVLINSFFSFFFSLLLRPESAFSIESEKNDKRFSGHPSSNMLDYSMHKNLSIYLRNTSNELNMKRDATRTHITWKKREKKRKKRHKEQNLHEKWYH